MFSQSRPDGAGNDRGAHASRSNLLATLGVMLLAGTALGGCGTSGKAAAPGGSSAAKTSTTHTQSEPATRSGSENGGAAVSSGVRSAITGKETSPGVVTAKAEGLLATLHATTHAPKVDAAWPISFSVTQAGRPAQAKLSYEYMFGGAVVAKRSHYSFAGHFKDVFRWPASSVGYPLTFRAVLLVAGRTVYLDYPVKVAR